MIRFGKQPSEAAQHIARLFAEDPEGWEAGEYRAIHKKSGIDVWIANRDYALHASLKGGLQCVPSPQRGGCRTSSKHIWRAFVAWRDQAALRAIRSAR